MKTYISFLKILHITTESLSLTYQPLPTRPRAEGSDWHTLNNQINIVI